jgi:DNA modification methylase
MTPYYADESVTLYHGDALAVLRKLPDESVDCVVTSPPYYGLRDYGEAGQYGLESSPDEYVETMLMVFAEVYRVLAADGTLWLNLGDAYVSGGSGSRTHPGHLGGRPNAATTPQGFGAKPGRPKNLLGIPWRVAFALQNDGWTLRNAIVWDKPNAMPESVRDRLSCTYEFVFLFSRSHWYHFDLDAIREPLAYPEALDGTRVFGGKSGGAGGVGATARRRGAHASIYGATGMPEQTNMGPTGSRHTHNSVAGRNPGDVWTLPTQPFPAAHFAVMAPALAERCILAGCRPGGVVLDPFCGVGTTGMVANQHGRRFVGIDLSSAHLDLALRTRLRQGILMEVADGR